MRRSAVSIVWVLVSMSFVGVLVIGYFFVPKVREKGSLSPDVELAVYIEILSVLASAAVIAPLTARRVKARSDQEWRTARLNARDRLHEAITSTISSYTTFLRSDIQEPSLMTVAEMMFQKDD